MLFFLACRIVQEQNRTWRPEAPIIDITPIQIDFSGTYEEGVFEDLEYDLTVVIPQGWNKQIGLAQENKRLMIFPEDETMYIEFWYFHSILIEPAPRDGCKWSFIDRGLYRSLDKEQMHLVATCFPTKSSDVIVQGHLAHHKKGTWQIEIHSTPEDFPEALKRSEELMSSVQINGVYEWQDTQ